MKAFVIKEYAHPSKLQLTGDAPEPVLTPGSEELLINVHSAGLNFFDVRPAAAASPPSIFLTRQCAK
jgi:NADPH2:quinone reductase